MKPFAFILYLTSAMLFSMNLSAQYITLRGKQFYNQHDSAFYPVICNYEMRFSCNNCNCGYGGYNCDSADYELQPHYQYGAGGTFEHPFHNGMDKVRADFIKMKQMGFNTVRIMTLYNNLMAHTKLDTSGNEVSGEQGGRIICVKYNSAYNDGASWWGRWFQVDTPYATNHNFQKIYLPKIHQLLDTAASVGINIIFTVAGGYISGCANVTTKNRAQANDYKDYLKELAKSLKNDSIILAYDLFNEPEWAPGWDPPYTWGEFTTKNKTEICEFTAMWYDTIKSIDNNHLITMGNGDAGGVFTYDPAIMKLDFNCHHIYPPFFYAAYNNYNKQKILDVFNTELYWASQVNPMPWILGETGAVAWTEKGHDEFAQDTDNMKYNYTAYHNLVGTNLSKPPYSNVWGNFDDQDTFARWSQHAVLNFGGSGYAWWQFQDIGKSKPFSDTVPPVDGFIGLLKPGNPNGTTPPYIYDTLLDKPFVSGAFRSNTPTTPNAPADMPFNYYNPYQGQYFTYSGRVVDQEGHPIKNAVVGGSNCWYHSKPKELWYANDSSRYKMPREYAFGIFTFTREDGSFDLVSPVQRTGNNIIAYNTYDYGRFDAVNISAPAANVYWWGTNDDEGAPSDTLIVLYRQTGIFDNNLVDWTILRGNNETYTARHILSTQDVIVESGAVGDFHASEEVDIKPGFESRDSSYTQIYIAPVEFNCGTLVDGNGYHYKTDESEVAKETPPIEKSIEVHYSLEAPFIRLLPNPANNTVYLESDKSGSCAVEISSITGGKVYSSTFYLSKQATLDVSSFAVGTYNVSVKLNNQAETFKLIINR